MTAAAFSSDGSVLAVAADKVITLWDPDRNTLLAVIGNSLEVHLKFDMLLAVAVRRANSHTWICPSDTFSTTKQFFP